MEEYDYLVDFLKDKDSEENAISAEDLGYLFNMTKRGIRSVVTLLRQNGCPICSSNKGYWYGSTREDIEKTGRRLMSQVENMKKAVDGMYKSLE